MQTETWKSITGQEERYAVSNQGRVKSLIRRKRRILHSVTSRGNTQIVHLVDPVTKKIHQQYVHTLVLEAFVGKRPKGLECCHYDGNARNNNLSNLRWDTHAANMADKIRHGNQHRGSELPWARLTETDVKQIRWAYWDAHLQLKQIGKIFDTSTQYVWAICHRRFWKHIA